MTTPEQTPGALAAYVKQAVEAETRTWRELTERPDHKTGPFMVTNNYKSMNSFGRPSHVWCVKSIHQERDGSFCAFDGFRKIEGLTMFFPVPDILARLDQPAGEA